MALSRVSSLSDLSLSIGLHLSSLRLVSLGWKRKEEQGEETKKEENEEKKRRRKL
jgi:hypothetical protein